MKSLGTIQAENLLAEIQSGHVKRGQLCVRDRSVCVAKGFTITTRVPCATTAGAIKLLDILRDPNTRIGR